MRFGSDNRSFGAVDYGRTEAGYGSVTTVDQSAPAVRGAFLNKVYLTMSAGIGVTMATAYFFMVQAMTPGPVRTLLMSLASPVSFIVVLLAYMGLSYAVHAASRVRGVNVLLFGLFCAFTGLIISPLFLVAVAQTGGMTIVWQAFAITVITFGSLTGYVLISGKDFSFMGGFLTVGIFVLLAFMFAGFFFNSWGFQMAVTCVGLLLFAGFVLYDTSVIMKYLSPEEWIAGALRLFVDFINMFIRVLSIMLNSRR